MARHTCAGYEDPDECEACHPSDGLMKIESEGRVGFAARLSMDEIERIFLSEVERRAGASREKILHMMNADTFSPGEREAYYAGWLRLILGGYND